MQDLRKRLFNEGLSRKDVSNLDTRINDATAGEKNRGKLVGRRPVVIAGATGVAIVGLYIAGRYFGVFDRAPTADFDYVISPSWSAYQVDFEPKTESRTFKFYRPTSADKIIFENKSGDSALAYSWSVDDKVVAETRDYSGKLSAGEHKVRLAVKENGRIVELVDKSEDPDTLVPPIVREILGASAELKYDWFADGQKMEFKDNGGVVDLYKRPSLRLTPGRHIVGLHVSDGIKEGSAEKAVTVPEGLEYTAEKDIAVDPADLPEYPKRKLRIPIKGINYVTGLGAWGMSPVPDDEMLESFSIIKNELSCNAIRLVGDYKDRIVRSVDLAKDMFDTIVVTPYNRDMDSDETVKSFVELSRDLEKIRESTDKTIVFTFGNELSAETKGIVPGSTYNERAQWVSVNGLNSAQQEKVNQLLMLLKEEISKNYKGQITYVRHPAENIDWDKLGFDIISLNEYFSRKWVNEEQYLKGIGQFTNRTPRKPVFITEFGYFTFPDALYWGGNGWWYILNNPDKVHYDEDAQARALNLNIELLNRTSVNGIFLWNFMEAKQDSDPARSCGVIKYDSQSLWGRKLSFYLYKNFTL